MKGKVCVFGNLKIQFFASLVSLQNILRFPLAISVTRSRANRHGTVTKTLIHKSKGLRKMLAGNGILISYDNDSQNRNNDVCYILNKRYII